VVGILHIAALLGGKLLLNPEPFVGMMEPIQEFGEILKLFGGMTRSNPLYY
jgi:hypothetical protein